ncbi:hypothetical protein HGRIS_004195 [Hohenbuehelia grisea]|uniref:CHAT domain-containing protein n=1 Tax=Hohenbuehelia grisea TaxID=104357 RepID=A0ABR3JHV5_9AGAR
MGEFDQLVASIRNTPGREDFLKPLSFDKLSQAATDGPVILVNCSEARSDVIIVFANRVPSIINLDASFRETALHIHKRYLNARGEAMKERVSDVFSTTLGEISKALWDMVVADVVAELKKCGVPEGSRIWWCPTSFLTALPFHAAGRGRKPKNANGGERPKGFLVDYYISSYTPTLKALIDARQSLPATSPQPPKILIVAQTNDAKLISAREELSVLEHQFANLNRAVLDNDTATTTSDEVSTSKRPKPHT